MSGRETNGGSCTSIPLLEWPGVWYETQAERPWSIWVSNTSYDEGENPGLSGPLQECSPFAIRLLAEAGLDSVLDRSQQWYDFPICLVQEDLTQDSVYRLDTALSVIQQMQHLDDTNALCFMTQIFLMFNDWKRAQKGLGSFFHRQLRTVVDESELDTEEWRHRQLSASLQFLNTPTYKLKSVLDFWNEAGGKWSGGFVFGEDVPHEAPEFSAIPPKGLPLGSTQRVKLRGSSAEITLAGEYHEVEAKFTFRKQGELWAIAFDGPPLFFNHSKGLSHIHVLLQYPNKPIHAFDFEKRDSSLPLSPFQRMNQDQLDEYQLRSGVPDEIAEKARKAVSNSIERALEKIQDEHSSFWRHLKNSIKTGRMCCYSPEEAVKWDL